jgi:hypothetical protein
VLEEGEQETRRQEPELEEEEVEDAEDAHTAAVEAAVQPLAVRLAVCAEVRSSHHSQKGAVRAAVALLRSHHRTACCRRA